MNWPETFKEFYHSAGFWPTIGLTVVLITSWIVKRALSSIVDGSWFTIAISSLKTVAEELRIERTEIKEENREIKEENIALRKEIAELSGLRAENIELKIELKIIKQSMANLERKIQRMIDE